MDTSVSFSEQKLQKCISDSWKLIDEEFKKYSATVQQGLSHIALFVAHTTALKNTASTNIEDTELFKSDPDIPLKLQFTLKREIHSEEAAITHILCSLHSSFSNIITQIDKIFNVYSSCNFQIQDITKGNETSLSILEMLETLDTFKRFFSENHIGRKSTIALYLFTNNVEKILELWNITEVTSLHQDLDAILTTECS